jgi:biopolymer transport protein ExbD
MKFDVPGPADEEDFPMTPMIDMVFLLLIFFMVASHLNQMEKVEIDVPIAESAVVPKELLDRRTITIKSDESLYIGNKRGELEQVTPLVRKQRASIPDLKIYLRADKRVKHRRVREVMKACADGGASEIIFASYEAP